MAEREVCWVFDQLPPSGARRGGDPSEHAFKHDLETFVREVVQNANDQALGFPAIRFEPVELEGDALEAFLQALDWRTLEPHLQAAAAGRGGAGLRDFLVEFQATRRLLLLHVEDRNTAGLIGDESDGDSNFRALCKDTLYSHKQNEAAGGSYGLGKSLLWSFSGLSTVLFNSVLFDDPAGLQSPRLIGRTELPSHSVRQGTQLPWYSGSGWFGHERQVDGGVRAESIWSPLSAELARRLHMQREPRSGTSILVVGFRDPAADVQDGMRGLAQRIGQAATRYFWPAMVMETRRLRLTLALEAGERLVAPDADPLIAPFLQCYLARGQAAAETLVKPGDIARRRIAVELPEARSGPQGTAYADLVVRLADERSAHPLCGHVAMFRGPGMVVRYWDRSNLALGVRPFHAVLVCGEARDPKQPSDTDRNLERFLRAAEPPGHDEWTSTPALKQHYKRGYARALQRLKDQIGEELRAMLLAQPKLGSQGPDKLQRRFPIGGHGARESEPAVFHFSRLSARFEAGRWQFSGAVRPERRQQAWHAELRLHELGEDGEKLAELRIERFELESKRAASTLSDGIATIEAPAVHEEVAFRGESTPLESGLVGVLGLEITGMTGAVH
jgi:hypothetical protein